TPAEDVCNTGNARDRTVPPLRAARPLTNSRRVIANFILPYPYYPVAAKSSPLLPSGRRSHGAVRQWHFLTHETVRMNSSALSGRVPLENDAQNWILATNSPLLGAKFPPAPEMPSPKKPKPLEMLPSLAYCGVWKGFEVLFRLG